MSNLSFVRVPLMFSCYVCRDLCNYPWGRGGLLSGGGEEDVGELLAHDHKLCQQQNPSRASTEHEDKRAPRESNERGGVGWGRGGGVGQEWAGESIGAVHERTHKV